jgi:hypothetical protein
MEIDREPGETGIERHWREQWDEVEFPEIMETYRLMQEGAPHLPDGRLAASSLFPVDHIPHTNC